MDRYIYVVSMGDHLIKIGMSAHPDLRLKELQNSSGTAMTLERTWARPKGEAIKVERRAHKLLRSCRTHGEWFACTKEEAIEAVEMALVPVPEKPPAPQKSRGPDRKPINVKGVCLRSWQAAKAAAKVRNVTMAVWLSDAIKNLIAEDDAIYAAQEALKAASPKAR